MTDNRASNQEGQKHLHSCGCVSQVIDGRWELVVACEGAVKLNVDTIFDRVRKEAADNRE